MKNQQIRKPQPYYDFLEELRKISDSESVPFFRNLRIKIYIILSDIKIVYWTFYIKKNLPNGN